MPCWAGWGPGSSPWGPAMLPAGPGWGLVQLVGGLRASPSRVERWTQPGSIGRDWKSEAECKLIPVSPLFPEHPGEPSRPFGWDVGPPACSRRVESRAWEGQSPLKFLLGCADRRAACWRPSSPDAVLAVVEGPETGPRGSPGLWPQLPDDAPPRHRPPRHTAHLGPVGPTFARPHLHVHGHVHKYTDICSAHMHPNVYMHT